MAGVGLSLSRSAYIILWLSDGVFPAARPDDNEGELLRVFEATLRVILTCVQGREDRSWLASGGGEVELGFRLASINLFGEFPFGGMLLLGGCEEFGGV